MVNYFKFIKNKNNFIKKLIKIIKNTDKICGGLGTLFLVIRSKRIDINCSFTSSYITPFHHRFNNTTTTTSTTEFSGSIRIGSNIHIL
jgi:hypothetical protein